MKKKLILLSMFCLCLSTSNAFSEDFATKAEAEALVKNVVKSIEAAKDKTFQEITNKDPKWINKDLYPMIYDFTGKCVAHGQNPRQVGKDLIDIVDADGKEFVKERVELAKSKPSFWQDYKFTDPITKKVLPKEAYCEKSADLIICAGVYKR